MNDTMDYTNIREIAAEFSWTDRESATR